MSEKNKLKSSIKYPTSLIINGDNILGVEITKSLIEQGGYVIVIDHDVEATWARYNGIKNMKLLTVLDFSSIEYLDEDLRRLDYVFYLGHEFRETTKDISSQEFLQSSNYLDLIIKLTHKFEAKFLLTSSIHAYQTIMSNGGLDANFDEENKRKHQTTYSQMEIQRYSEALLLEAIDKFDIDARIVRMGRVIGKEMNLDPTNSFDKLVYQAAKGEDLEIEFDGLETNMYIHVLDAAYGLIKSMFSKGTKGKIYSLSNEEEITDLSIAYKLQELTGQMSEIKFIDTKSILTPLKFHKPGINLSTLGWSPKISFTRAINQVLDYTTDLINKENEKGTGPGTEEGPDNSNSQNLMQEVSQQSDEPQGALARLIAERKAQENARRGSILMAGEKARASSKKRRQLSGSEKVQRKFQAFYDTLAFKLTFLKKITITEALFYLTILILFGIIYVALISPIFVIGKNVVRIEYYKNQLDRDSQESNLTGMSEDISSIDSSLEDILNSLQKLEVIFDVTGEDQRYEKIYNYMRYLSLYSDQLSQASEQTVVFDNYWNNSDLGIIYKPNSESLFSVSNSDIDEENLEKVKSYDTRIKANIEGISTASDSLQKSLPVKLFGYDSARAIESLRTYEGKSVEVLNMISNYSELIVRKQDATYAVIIQDNSLLTPGGGYPASIGYIHIQDNKIVDVSLTSLDENNDSVIDTLTESEKKEIQLSSNSINNASSIKFSELFLIRDRSKIYDDIGVYYESNYGVSPDAIFFFDLETLSQTLEVTGPVELNQVKIEQEGILNSINLLQGSETTKEKRNEIITNIFAAQVNYILKNKRDLYRLLPIFFDSSRSSGVNVESEDADIKGALLSDAFLQRSDDFLDISIATDPELVDPELFPSINVKVEDFIDQDFNTERKVLITQGSTENIERITVCMPSGAKNFDISKSEIVLGQTFLADEACVVGDFDTGKSVEFTYVISKGIDNLTDAGYNKNLELISSAGLDVVYDYEAGLDPLFTITEEENIIISNQKVIKTGTIEGRQSIIFKFTK